MIKTDYKLDSVYRIAYYRNSCSYTLLKAELKENSTLKQLNLYLLKYL